MIKKLSVILVTCVLVGCATQPEYNAVDITDLPKLDKQSAVGLEIECYPSSTQYLVGDSVNIMCTITNTTDQVKPVAWNTNVGAHFVLVKGEKLSMSGLLPKAEPLIRSPLTIQPGYPPTTERILYLPPRNSITFKLSVGKAKKPDKFKGRIVYDPQALRDGWVVMDEESEPSWKKECAISDLFKYEVLAGQKK